MEFEGVSQENNTEVTLSALIQAATRGEDSDWEFIDNNLPALANNPVVIEWARTEGLDSSDENLGDLAGSILEASNFQIDEETRDKLLGRATSEGYDGFRAACALFVRGDRSKQVIKRLEDALEEEDTKTIAEKYLSEKND